MRPSILQLTSSGQDTAAAASGDAFEKRQATDAKLALLKACEVLPELQLRLQTAVGKMGTILSQVDGLHENTAATVLRADGTHSSKPE